LAYKISTSGANRPIIWIQGGIHAREWISPALVNWFAENFIVEYKAGNSVTKNILDNYNVYIVPVFNPDGYVYTQTDRNWRKNRNPAPSGSTCIGVDLNRNYNTSWGQGGSSTNPCSDTYMGTAAGNQREVAGEATYLKKIQGSYPIYAAIDYHSYSQLVLRPWGCNSSNSPNETVLKGFGDKISSDIRSVHGRVYTSQKSYDLYVTTGTASDYWYDNDITNGNVRGTTTYRVASFTIELRPASGSSVGFLLPPAEIIPTSQENWLAAKNFFTSVLTAPVIKT
jgi:murein tripeptide amidase MpaA